MTADDPKVERALRRMVLRRYMRRHFRLTYDKRTLNPFAARHFWESVGFALEGLVFAFQQERNLRIHLTLQLVLLAFGFWWGVEWMAWVLLALIALLISFAELANTTLEWLVDLLTQGRYDIRAKRVKDVAAGTCLLCSGVGYSLMLMVILLGRNPVLLGTP